MRSILIGLGLAVGLIACSGFSYRYYAWDYQHKTLVGHTQADDLPESHCDNADGKTKCIVTDLSEFFRLKGDMEKLQADLKACQGH